MDPGCPRVQCPRFHRGSPRGLWGSSLLDAGGTWLLFQTELLPGKGQSKDSACGDFSFHPQPFPLSPCETLSPPPPGLRPSLHPLKQSTSTGGQGGKPPFNLCHHWPRFSHSLLSGKSAHATSLLRKIQWFPDADEVFWNRLWQAI